MGRANAGPCHHLTPDLTALTIRPSGWWGRGCQTPPRKGTMSAAERIVTETLTHVRRVEQNAAYAISKALQRGSTATDIHRVGAEAGFDHADLRALLERCEVVL